MKRDELQKILLEAHDVITGDLLPDAKTIAKLRKAIRWLEDEDNAVAIYQGNRDHESVWVLR